VEKHQLDELLKWLAGCWKPAVCLAFLHAFLAKVQTALDDHVLHPEGTILVAERRPQQRQFTFKTVGVNDTAGQRQWAVLTDEFKVVYL
jgi:hypothetical protein